MLETQLVLKHCQLAILNFLCVYDILDFKYEPQQTNMFRPMFHFVDTVHLLGLLLRQLAPGGPPACIGDPASIETIDLDPRLLLETWLLFETRLVFEVLRYLLTLLQWSTEQERQHTAGKCWLHQTIEERTNGNVRVSCTAGGAGEH